MKVSCAPQYSKWNISFRNYTPRCARIKTGVLSFLRITTCWLRYKDTRVRVVRTKSPAAFFAKMAPQTVRRHAGDGNEQVHLHPPDEESRLQSPLHRVLPRQPPQPGTLLEFKILKSAICRPDIYIRILLFPMWNFSMMMRIPSTIPILIQICSLIKVGTLCLVWQSGTHSLWRHEQQIVRSCNWLRELTDIPGILEIIIIYIYLLLKENVVIKKKVNENIRNATKTMWMMDCAKMNDCI